MSDEVAVEPIGRDLGITLSGGGHRATVFSLGALLAISDAGLRERVTSIGSVSGGSIANGAVMVGPDFGTADAAEIEAHFGALVRAVAERGVLLGRDLADSLSGGAPATRWYLRSVIASFVLVVLALFAFIVALLARWWVVLAAALVVAVVSAVVLARAFSRRSVVVERAIDAELLGDVQTTLADQQARNLSVHHVMCTSELQVGTSFYFSNRLVYGWEFGGSTIAPALPLATAVQASACVPGAFRARPIPLATIGLSSPSSSPATDRIVVVDGGVYDNMADEWEYGYRGRSRSWPAVTEAQPNGAEFLVVVNASAGWRKLKPVDGGGAKFELAGVLRSKDIQYDVSTSHRRRALFQQFQAWPDAGAFQGLFIQIDDNPYRLLRMIEADPQPGAGITADDRLRWAAETRAFLDEYGRSEADWDDIAEASAAVATTLASLGAEVCTSLLEHAYMLTAANLHVLFGLGATDAPVDRDRFRRLAGAA